MHNVSAVLLTVFAGLASLVGLLFLENPAIWRIDVGGVFFNLLLLGYAMPAVLALLLSYAVRRPAPGRPMPTPSPAARWCWRWSI